MYADYWNLKGNPFLNVIDPRFWFSSEPHEEAIARFCFLAENGRLAGVLTGPYGVGKSAVLKTVAARLEAGRRPVLRLDAIPGGQLPMARQILASLRLDCAATNLPEALMSFWQATQYRADSLVRTVLCLDEAHQLAADNGLALVHFLTNLRLVNRKTQVEEPFFTILLAGAPELLPALQTLPSLRERIQIVYELPPLTAPLTSAYIQHHMRAVGGDIWSFAEDALAAIFRLSGGLPRRINLLCDTALLLGFAAKAPQVTPAIVAQAAADVGLTSLPPPEPVQPRSCP